MKASEIFLEAIKKYKEDTGYTNFLGSINRNAKEIVPYIDLVQEEYELRESRGSQIEAAIDAVINGGSK